MERDGTRRRWRRWSLVFAVGYLLLLAPDLWGLATSPRAHRGVLAAVALFVAFDLWYWVRVAVGRRREREGVALLAVLCAIAAGAAADDGGWALLFIYCAVAAAALTDEWRRAVAGMAVVLGLATAVSAALRVPLDAWLSVVVVGGLGGAAAIGVAQLVERNLELRRAREEVARLAVAEERLRFARDLHDLLGRSLSLIVLKSELAGRLVTASPERAAAEVRDVERVARDALREVREAVGGYRLSSLSRELESSAAALGAAGVAVEVDARAGALPAAVDATLAWALREGVTNVLRHSRARWVSVRVTLADGRAELEVIDDGVGCEGRADGNGLRGLRERVGASGGALHAAGRPEGGFRLAVRLPAGEPARPPEPAPA
jgi:two-component system sensor histidine kinase DesK